MNSSACKCGVGRELVCATLEGLNMKRALAPLEIRLDVAGMKRAAPAMWTTSRRVNAEPVETFKTCTYRSELRPSLPLSHLPNHPKPIQPKDLFNPLITITKLLHGYGDLWIITDVFDLPRQFRATIQVGTESHVILAH